MEQQQNTPNFRERFSSINYNIERYKVIMHNDDVTTMEFVIRLTSAVRIPSSFRTAFSTWEEQAEQVIPVISNFCFKEITFLFYTYPPGVGGVFIAYPLFPGLSMSGLPAAHFLCFVYKLTSAIGCVNF